MSEIRFNQTCPECGPNGTRPIQSLRDSLTVEPCQTCQAAWEAGLRKVGHDAAQTRERLALESILASCECPECGSNAFLRLEPCKTCLRKDIARTLQPITDEVDQMPIQYRFTPRPGRHP